MAPVIDHIYLARDAYDKWRRCIQKAKFSVTIFTPFLDRRVEQLFNAAGLEVNCTLITTCDARVLLEHPQQLYTMIRLLEAEHEVLLLRDLHAKVLLIDDKTAALGSQNFTVHGGRQKECTFASDTDLTDSKFLQTLEDWRRTALPADIDLLNELVQQLTPFQDRFVELITSAQKTIDIAESEIVKRKQRERRRKFEHLERSATVRMPQGAAYASMKTVTDINAYHTYKSLIADPEYDLTCWNDKTGKMLERTGMYPALIADTNRMAFVRITKTRLTYFRDVVVRKTTICDKNVYLRIEFPKTHLKKRNLIVHIKRNKWFGYSYSLEMLFTGESLQVRRSKFRCESPEGSQLWREAQNFREWVDLMLTEKRQEEFLHNLTNAAFSHFKYVNLGIEKKNVREYLDGYRYRISLIEIYGMPIIVILKLS